MLGGSVLAHDLSPTGVLPPRADFEVVAPRTPFESASVVRTSQAQTRATVPGRVWVVPPAAHVWQGLVAVADDGGVVHRFDPTTLQVVERLQLERPETLAKRAGPLVVAAGRPTAGRSLIAPFLAIGAVGALVAYGAKGHPSFWYVLAGLAGFVAVLWAVDLARVLRRAF